MSGLWHRVCDSFFNELCEYSFCITITANKPEAHPDSYRLVVVRLVFLWGEELGLEFVGVSSTDHILSYGSCCGFCGGCFLSCSFSCCCLSGGGFLCCCFCCGCLPCCGLLCRSFRWGFLFDCFFSSFLSCFCLLLLSAFLPLLPL